MPLLELRGVVKRFGGLHAVREVSFGVEQGEIRALIGPNGSGKSTCVNVISGVYAPTRGQVIFKEEPIGGRPSYKIARLGLARTFQNVRLFKQQTVLENVMVASEVEARHPLITCLWRGPGTRRAERAAREEAERALAFVGLEAALAVRADSLPYGKQRLLEIARAIARGPDLLLLDEPAAGLNPEETATVAAKIRSLRDAGMTILLVEHKMSMVMSLSDRITVLEFGEKIAEGTPAEIRVNEDVIRAYLGRSEEYLGV
jgi:branched-chain amino acid transport system ATP-binding protein